MNALYTVGHGSRTLTDFLGLLQRARIETLIDVRAFPASPRYPHFAGEALQSALANIGVHDDWPAIDKYSQEDSFETVYESPSRE